MTGTGRMRHAEASRVSLTRPGAYTPWTRIAYFARTRPVLTRGSRGEGTLVSILIVRANLERVRRLVPTIADGL